MNLDAVALQCCEKLSQQMNILKEVEEKTLEQKKLQLKIAMTRLKANQLRCTPSDLALSLREFELNAQAYRAACREIEAVSQRYRESWRNAEVDSEQVLKELDLGQKKLLSLELELQEIQRERKSNLPRTNRVKMLINQFATMLSKLKSSVDKLEIMMRRYEISLDEVNTNESQARNLLKELQAQIRNRQIREQEINERYRVRSAASLVKEYMQRGESSYTRNECQEETSDDMDEEILNERLRSERETNKQLEVLSIHTQKWLQKEEAFAEEVKMLEAIQGESI